MAQELTTGSWSSLAPQDRVAVFRRAMSRVEQVSSTSNIRHLTCDPLDAFLPAVIEAMERKLEPAGPQAAREAVSLACQILRCRFPEGDVLAAYVAVLAEMPRDLLMPSIREALAKETHHVLPTPGALLNLARPQRIDRERMLSATRHALKRLALASLWSRKGLGGV